MTQPARSIPDTIATILSRVVVPLWVLGGALFKLYERNPGNLPSVIRDIAKSWNVDLGILLRTLIGLELFAVGVMLLVPRFARLMAIFMLSCFCLIVVAEIRRQATKCGCFGSLPIKPWHMLVVDGSLLVALVACSIWSKARGAFMPSRPSLAKSGLAMVLLGGLGMAVSFGVPNPPETVQVVQNDGPPTVPPIPGGSANSQPSTTHPIDVIPATQADPTINPNPLPIPGSWYVKGDIKQWYGSRWRDLELFKLMPKWPSNMDQGKHYVVFYKRDCDHCHDMFLDHLLIPLDAPVTAVQIPYNKTELMPPAEDTWPMPGTPCELLALPLKCNWIITPPLAMTFVDGKLTCAIEGEGYETCLGVAKLH